MIEKVVKAAPPDGMAKAIEGEQQLGKKARRQGVIMKLLEQVGYASVEELAARFNMTTQTVRRDIAEMEATGRIRRHHGGITPTSSIDPGIYRQRRVERVDAKRRIGALTASLVEPGSSVFLDAGTTCEAVAEALTAVSDLRVVTYNLHAATLLSDRTDFTIAIPAGFVRNVDGSVLGNDGTAFLSRFRFDWAIVSVSGIEEDGRLSDDDDREVALVRRAMSLSRKVVLAADHSKFGRSGLVELCGLADVSTVVTDRAPGELFRSRFQAEGVELHVDGVTGAEHPTDAAVLPR